MLAAAEPEQLPVGEARALNPEAWDILVRRFQKPLYVYAAELLGTEQAALDVVQETFLSAFKHIRQLRDDRRVGSWLFGIAHQKCAQIWRRQKQVEVPLDPIAHFEIASGAEPVEILIRKEEEALFLEILNQLPPAQRAALLLYFLEGFTIDEIAAITQAPPGTVKSRLFHAKQTLRSKLKHENSA